MPLRIGVYRQSLYDEEEIEGQGSPYPPQEIDGMARQLREQNRVDGEPKRVSGDGKSTPFSQQERFLIPIGNPAIPHSPEGYGGFNFAQSETRGRRLLYAPYAWPDVREPDGTAVFDDGLGYGKMDHKPGIEHLASRCRNALNYLFWIGST